MDLFVTKFLKISQTGHLRSFHCNHIQIPLKLAGLWPQQSLFQRRLIFGIHQIILLLNFAPNVVFLIQQGGRDYDILIEILFSSLLDITFSVCHLMAYINAAKFEELHSISSKAWHGLLDEEEKGNFEEYSRIGYFIGLGITVYLLVIVSFAVSFPMIPVLLDFIFPLGTGPRPHLIIIQKTYVIFEQQDHYYITSIHLGAGLFVYGTIISSNSGIFVLSMEHICGFLSVTSCRLSNIVTSVGPMEEIRKPAAGHIELDDLRDAIKLHNQALKLCSLIEKIYSLMALVTESVAVAILAMLYFYVLHGHATTMKKLLIVFLIVAAYFFLMIVNWLGQQITNHSEKVSDSIYLSSWYLLSAKDRKLLLTIMLRLQRLSILTAGKISVLSVESFSQLVKMSTSYFTAILTVASND